MLQEVSMQGRWDMNREKYLHMGSEDLYKHLISDILADPSAAKGLVKGLESAQRYREDPCFRVFVETGKGLVCYLHGDHKKVIAICTQALEKAMRREMWQLVSTNQNFLGNAYFVVGSFERALEYYRRVIRTEEAHGLFAMTSIAYNNIALIYDALDQYDKSYENAKLAIAALEQGGKDQPRYDSKLVFYLGVLISALCRLNRLEEIPPALERVQNFVAGKINPDAMYMYHLGKMFYAFHRRDFEEGKSEYYRAVSFIQEEDSTKRMGILNDFLTLSKSFDLDRDFYVKELLEAESIGMSERMAANLGVCSALLEYYRSAGNNEKLAEMRQKYIEILEKNQESIRKRSLSSIEMVDDILKKSVDIERIESKNTELQQAANEAIKHKNAFAEACAQIKMINELGKNMTASLDLKKVVDSIYQNLKKTVPLDIFVLMTVDSEKRELRSVAYYRQGVLYPDFSVKLEDLKGIWMKCCQRDQMLIVEDAHRQRLFAKESPFFNEEIPVRSAVFIPLKVGEDFVGICSLQNRREGVYSEENIRFLEQLIPYLSIALNNAIRSKRLEQEIEAHLAAQAELERTNDKLAHLSALDGLTQISNRRDFEMRISGLIKTAETENKEVSVFMLDIDNFKIYNDTYGHLEGDEVLKKVAGILRRNLEIFDGLCARFGGEEFICACAGLEAGKSEDLANKIRQEILDLNIENKDAPLRRISVSIGIAVGKASAPLKKSSLMRWADISLYKAKRRGKNTVITKEIDRTVKSYD